VGVAKPGDRVILETLKYLLGSTIREVYAVAQAIILTPMDPIKADGEVFEFRGMLDVPGPRDQVDLLEAREETGRQIKTCEMLLQGEVQCAKAVLTNSIRWCEFWQVRAPTPELRAMFGKSLRRLLSGIEESEDGTQIEK
jgi:hypothetical protein